MRQHGEPARHGWRPLKPASQSAFAAADKLVVEADVTAVEPVQLAQMVLARALSPSGSDLASVMSEAAMDRLEEILARSDAEWGDIDDGEAPRDRRVGTALSSGG